MRCVSQIMIALMVSFLVGCGIDEGRHYDGSKQFTETSTEQPGRSAEANPAPTPEAAKPPSFNRGASSESDSDLGGEIDPNELVLHNRYRARFDIPTALRLIDDKPPETSLGLARSTVESRLSGTTDKDGVTVSQTYGDGQSRSSGKQLIINTPGDAELKDGQAANSGMQAFDRVTSDPSCPSSLVCIDRLTFEPTTGDPMTFCFYDGTGKRVAVPYAIPPNIKYQELAPLAKVYGPYVAKRYRMPDMSCDNPIGEPDVVETYSTEIRQGPQPSPATQNFFIRAASFNFDYEAEMIHQRVANDNRAPYIDETIKMQAKTRYVFDAGKSTLVKMIKTVRSTVELPFPINLVMSMDGLQVDLHFELCENLMTGFEASYCD